MSMTPTPTVSLRGLAELLCRSETTVRTDRTRCPESLPPACVLPGTKRPVWIVSDVMEWLRQHRIDGVTSHDVVAKSTTTRATKNVKHTDK